MRLTSIFEVELTDNESESPFEDRDFKTDAAEAENLRGVILDGLGYPTEENVKVLVRFVRHRVDGGAQTD